MVLTLVFLIDFSYAKVVFGLDNFYVFASVPPENYEKKHLGYGTSQNSMGNIQNAIH